MAGDFMGYWQFPHELQVGDKVIFEDMIHYTTVKTTLFNGVSHPSIVLWTQDDKMEVLRKFGYEDYKSRMDGYSVGISTGIISPNEARRKENMPALPEEEGGDFHIVNGTFIKLRDVGQQYGVASENEEPKPEEEPMETEEPQAEEKDEKHENRRHAERKAKRKAERRGGSA